MKLINVVVADSSPAVCRLIKSYLESAADIRVVGTAQQGQAVIELVEAQGPDVITLGLEMPDMNGIDALKIIQQIRATPAIVISSANTHAAAKTVEALQHGAVDFVFKFTPGKAIEPEALRREIINKVRVASYLNPALLTAETGTPPIAVGQLLTEMKPSPQIGPRAEKAPGKVPEKVIVVGASMGGPIALRQLLSHLPADFASSVIVVQQLPPSFTTVLAEQLHEQLSVPVKEAEAGHLLQAGTVFITPGQCHLQIEPEGQFRLLTAAATESLCPSINLTMQSVAEVYQTKARGVLLTGMGEDGLTGLAAIRQHGGTTFVQTPETCTAPGMPQRAIAAGVADHVASPEHIAHLLLQGY